MNTPIPTRNSASDLFGKRHDLNRRILGVVVLTTLVHGAAYWHLATRMAEKSQYLVIDDGTFYLPKALDFIDAKQLHVSQAELLMESLLDRGPNGPDHPERLKRLCEKTAYEEAMQLIRKDAEAFSQKKLHQKVEIQSVGLIQTADDSVIAAVEGQLLRSGEFGGEIFHEVLAVKARLTFVRNPSMLTNGAFPSLLRTLQLETPPLSTP